MMRRLRVVLICFSNSMRSRHASCFYLIPELKLRATIITSLRDFLVSFHYKHSHFWR